MSNSDNPFEPTIEEATMSSGLHQQRAQPSLDNLVQDRLADLDRPSLTLNIPADQNVSLSDIEKDLSSIAGKIGSNVKVNIAFTMKKG
ncbi:MAG: hypothetical protein ABJN14_12345 [Paracoccaceae bacterium]